MNKFIVGVLFFLIIIVFFWTCKTSIEPFATMRPWFGYEPGIYGPGWGRTGCSNNKFCMKD
jgi:uncharacterized membrane protein YdcZ (DUF606 family)